MARTTIDLAYEGKIARLTFNRPEKRNAFDDTMLSEFDEAVREVAGHDGTSVLIIRGAGGSFSAGYDVAPAPRRDPDAPRPPRPDILHDRARLEETLKRWMLVRDMPQPVIAQVEGHCIGGATQLCAMCDIVIAAEDARFAWPGLPLGGGFISPIWAWLVGAGRAKYMSFRPGSAVDGREAAAWGFATFAVPPADIEAEVDRVAREIARVPLEILRVKKLAINRQMDVMGFATAVKMGVEWDAILHESDAVKAMRALVREKGIRGAIDTFRGDS